MTKVQRQIARLRVALHGLNDETGGQRTREGDKLFGEAWGALCALERLTGVTGDTHAEDAA